MIPCNQVAYPPHFLVILGISQRAMLIIPNKSNVERIQLLKVFLISFHARTGVACGTSYI